MSRRLYSKLRRRRERLSLPGKLSNRLSLSKFSMSRNNYAINSCFNQGSANVQKSTRNDSLSLYKVQSTIGHDTGEDKKVQMISESLSTRMYKSRNSSVLCQPLVSTTSAPAIKDTVLVLNSNGGGWLPAVLIDTQGRLDELRNCF